LDNNVDLNSKNSEKKTIFDIILHSKSINFIKEYLIEMTNKDEHKFKIIQSTIERVLELKLFKTNVISLLNIIKSFEKESLECKKLLEHKYSIDGIETSFIEILINKYHDDFTTELFTELFNASKNQYLIYDGDKALPIHQKNQIRDIAIIYSFCKEYGYEDKYNDLLMKNKNIIITDGKAQIFREEAKVKIEGSEIKKEVGVEIKEVKVKDEVMVKMEDVASRQEQQRDHNRIIPLDSPKITNNSFKIEGSRAESKASNTRSEISIKNEPSENESPAKKLKTTGGKSQD